MRASVLLLLCATVAHAQSTPVPTTNVDATFSPRTRLEIALRRFEVGDYATVAADLESLVESPQLKGALPRADRLEALRAYGIACALIGRTTAAEGAFLLLLEADPATTMNPAFVRPEAVQLFESVRERNRATLRQAYQRGRGRRYAVLNLLPPAGQLQNHQYAKGYGLLGIELALIALDVTTGSLLYEWRGAHDTFGNHADAANKLIPVNWASFGALIAVAVYGICDGFVVGHRRAREERTTLDRLGANTEHLAPTLALDSAGVGFHF